MKSIINRIFIASALTFSLSACSDFLNKEPLSQGTEAIVFKTPEHFEQAAYYLYDLYGWDYNAMDRNLDISGLGSNGGGTAPEFVPSPSKSYPMLGTYFSHVPS